MCDRRLFEVKMQRQRMPSRGRDGGLLWYLQNAEKTISRRLRLSSGRDGAI